MSPNFSFWKNAYIWGWATIDLLRLVVKTESNPFGEITKEEFRLITGEEFEPAA